MHPEAGLAGPFDADQASTIPLTFDDIFCALWDPMSLNADGAVSDLDGDELFVTLADQHDPAELRAAPAAVQITTLEQNDAFTVTNVSDDATATITDIVVEAADSEEPEFSVAGPGCLAAIGPGESCTYTVVVSSRPEPEGRVTIEYTDGTEEAREDSVSVSVDLDD